MLFCTSKHGWGWENFLAEANAGSGVRFPRQLYLWTKYGIPVLMLIIFVMGYAPLVRTWLGVQPPCRRHVYSAAFLKG